MQEQSGRIRITLVKSVIGYRETQRQTVRSLGLRRIRQSVIHHDTPTIRGMVTKVRHLVTVEPVGADVPAPRQQTGAQRFKARIEKRVAEREALMVALGLLDGIAIEDEGAVTGIAIEDEGAVTGIETENQEAGTGRA